MSTISLNLQDQKSQALVESMVIQTRPAAIHLGLPCGTCSRARDKPLPAHLKAQFHDPLPLRDAHNLLGFLILQFCWKYGIRISIDFFLVGTLCLSAGHHLRYSSTTSRSRPRTRGNRSAASCLCTVLRRALYHYTTRSPASGFQ